MYDVIIIGAGPAGLMAGIQSSKKTLILEKNNSAGKKLLITGGGRCNITNNKNNKEFLENIDTNRKHLYSTINNFGPKDIINFFEYSKVKLKEESENRMFPITNRSYTILEALLKKYNGEIRYNENVLSITKQETNYTIETNNNIYKTKKIIIATGGSSYRNTGSTGDNIKFGKELNQPVIKIYPAEVGIILEKPTNIAGSSIENVLVKIGKIKKQGPLMFTHRGLSGNSIMLASEHIYKNNLKEIEIDLLPNVNEEELKNNLLNYDNEKEIHSFLEIYYSKKISDFILINICVERNKKIKQLSKKQILSIINFIKHSVFNVKKVENLDLAYVTGGGIDMKYINSKTMESTINEGVFFVGEALDIHGPIGGYNLTLALSTGFTAGKNV